jgi:cytochrome c5
MGRFRRFAARSLGVLALLATAPGWTETAALQSVKVELPLGDREFAGPGAEAVNGVCLACHSAEMVLYQPKLSAAAWTAEVHKMGAVFKAPIQDADIPAIVDYLVKLQTPP